MKFKVFLPYSCGSSESLFERMGFEIVKNIESADVIHFSGGSDINPKLYKAKGLAENHYTPCYAHTERERVEVDAYNFAIKNKKFMTGFCRGAQFLCAMNGGNIIQNVNNHQVSHRVTLLDTGQEILVNSLHHQMMMNTDKAIILAKPAIPTSSIFQYEAGGTTYRLHSKDLKMEEEAMWIPETRCLGVQWHPEYTLYSSDSMNKVVAHTNVFARWVFKYLEDSME